MRPSPITHQMLESLDGVGAGDHDVPYTFGRLPGTANPFPFSTRQFVRLMVLRSRLREAKAANQAGG